MRTEHAVTERAVTDHHAFTLALHRAAAPDPHRSACWSPCSVAAALGMTATAARGATRDELLAALAASASSRPDALTDLAGLLRSAADLDAEEAELHLASTAWLRADLAVAAEFPHQLARWPAGAVRGFGPDLDAARHAINEDVARTTRGLIPELLGAGVLRPETAAVLVSALYLRAAWLRPFDRAATRPRPFTTPDGAVRVPTMELESELGYRRDGDWQVVSVPVRGGLEALILLPDAPLPEAEPALSAPSWHALQAPPPPRPVRLRLPRLRLEWSRLLGGPLGALGVRTAFDPERADLTGMTPTGRAWVDEIVHRAVLRVDEQGVEGAAATAVVVAMRALPVPRTESLLVAVDRPFLLLLRHRRTGVIYFLARITDPS